jgi:hypothetical protein
MESWKRNFGLGSMSRDNSTYRVAAAETEPLMVHHGEPREISLPFPATTINFCGPEEAEQRGNLTWSIFIDSLPGPFFLDSLFKTLLTSIPVILSYILQNSIQTISVLIAGRLGPDELSVAAFSLMLAFVTGE